MKTDKRYEENAKRLKLAMSEAGLSQKDLSARTGIGKSSLSQYMNGLNWPDDNRKVGQIAEILNVNPAWLMGFNVQMHTEDDASGENSQQAGWYTDSATAKAAQEIFDDPDLHALFDAARDSKPEALKAAAALLKVYKETNYD